ncbi:hypothetical protein, partial [Streptomyces microflavus]|uniref:hypothetical protein n=1 Tax=Streptomyces microflavus TaxID=1919 RepID=UPI0033F08B98
MPNRFLRLARFDQRLDLTKPDLGVAGGTALLEQLLNDRRLPVPRRGLTCAEVCEERGFIELLRDGHRSGDGLRSATNKTPELLIEMSDVS